MAFIALLFAQGTGGATLSCFALAGGTAQD